MKSIVFFCDSYGRGALISALIHLGVIVPNKLTINQLIQLTWWKQINRLAPGQLLEVGCDAGENRIFVLWVKGDRELLPRLADTLETTTEHNGQIVLVDAIPKTNWIINLARSLSKLLGNNCLSHYLFLTGIYKLNQPTKQPLPKSLLSG